MSTDTKLGISKARPLVLVGAGKMGSAMLEGWIVDRALEDAIHILDPGLTPIARKKFADMGIPCHDFMEDAPTPSVLFLAIKPQIMGKVLSDLSGLFGHANSGAMVVCSIVAGIRTGTLTKTFGPNTIVIRAMPNLPVSVKRGVTALYSPRFLPLETTTLIERLLQANGKIVWLDHEEELDLVTALSGSGPAYVFHLVEALAQAGEDLGLSSEVAMILARQTVSGAGELLFQSDEAASALRQDVTSPQGTTAAGLDVLMAENDGLRPLVKRTIQAAYKRAIELGQQT